ncbi:PAS domain-containing protein [Marinicauda algicola]|uniref:PAS domain-containing protein n=1 Tax=Marinicauda algicola TaxID=2029849 RepID=UPI0013053BE4|nr:PAS domain-containing protein [Marinicauda algicola]
MASPAEGLIAGAFDALPEACAVIDSNGRIVRANAAFAALFSASSDSLAGRDLAPFYADPLDLHLAPWRTGSPSGQTGPVRLVPPRGEPFLAELRAAPAGSHFAVVVRPAESARAPAPDAHGGEGAYTLDFASGTVWFSGALCALMGVEADSGHADLDRWLDVVEETDREAALALLKAGPRDPNHLFRFTCRVRGADGVWRPLVHQVRVLRRGRRGQPLRLSGVAAPAGLADVPAHQEDARLSLALAASGLCHWEYDFEADIGSVSGDLHAGGDGRTFSFADWRARLHPDDVSRASAAFLGLQFGGRMDEIYRVRGSGQGWVIHRCLAEPAGRNRAFGFTRLVGLDEAGPAASLPGDVEGLDREAAQSVRSAALTTWTRDLQTGMLTVRGPIAERLGIRDGTLQVPADAWLERIHPDDRERFDLASLRHIAAAEGGELEYRIRDMENRYVRLRVRGGVSAQTADGRALTLSGIVTEVDETDALRRKLAETETRLTEAVEAARLTRWSFDYDDRLFLMSGPALAAIGFEGGDQPGAGEGVRIALEDWIARMHPDDLPRFREALATAAARDGAVEIEYRLRDSEGGYRWVGVRGAITERTPDGAPLRASGFLSEVTDRRRLEEELAARERQLADAIEAGLVGIWTIDHTTGERNARGDVLRWLGKSLDESRVTAEEWGTILHPDSVEAARELFARLGAGEIVGAIDLRLRSPDGWRWVRTEGRPLAFDAAGRALRSAGVMLDISAERAFADALAREKERIDTIYRRSPALMHTIDTQGRTTMVNDHWVATMGYKPEEVLGQPGSAVIHEADRERVERELIPRAFETGELWREPVRIVTKAGEVLETRLSAFVEYGPGRQPVAAHGVFEDVTDINRARREMEAYAEELERTNRELNRFATVASHDLQEPLRKIAAFSSLLRRRYHGQLDAEADSSLDFLIDAAGRMRTLIDDLLAYSRASSRPLKRERVDLERLVEDILARLEVSIAEAGGRVDCERLPVIEGDPMLLTLLFQNLVSNAIKYRGEAAPQVRIAAEPEGEFWRISVSDNGIGIESKFFDKIFAPFQRLHGREEYDGTGIGLAVCQQAVERHGGKIWLESEPGKGSRFHFTLPRSEAQDAAA